MSTSLELDLQQLERSIRAHEQAPARRKRKGVFYTPDWIAAYLVDETLGRRLAELRVELGLSDAASEGGYRRSLAAYAARLDALRVLDPACGAGALLCAALHRMASERRWLARERRRVEPDAGWRDDVDAAMSATLAHNLHGLDIDGESVELTKRLLWLHAGRSESSRAVLERNIRVADALVDESLEGGFDCVIANPPYVKYQQLRGADDLRGRYASASRGNFDLYLPFIERGLSLLAPGGRVGVIAPSVWVKQGYGEALRQLVRRRRALERWLDFGALQVFEGATTYTALQFFTQREAVAIDVRSACDCELAAIDWDRYANPIPYESLPEQGAWHLLGSDEGRLLATLEAAGTPLSEHVESISVGVQTSADDLYHLHELAPGRYESKGGGVVDLEPELVRPLVSGTDVRRWQRPRTTRRILFPYQVTEQGVELVSAGSLPSDHPKTWAYLRAHEARLRGREGGKFDDDRWFRFGRNQNIDKQHLGKILVPRLVRHLAATPDLDGAFVADNVDVGYLITRTHEQAWFLLAILNSTIADWWFRRTSKPFRGDYRSANRQYLAPLPVPAASDAQRALVVAASKQVHALHEQLAGQLDELDARLRGSQVHVEALDPTWIWPDLATPERYAEQAPAAVKGRGRQAFGRRRFQAELAARMAAWGEIEGPLAVEREGAKLRIVDAGRVVQDWLVVDEPASAFIAACWRHGLRRAPASAEQLLEVIGRRIATKSQALRKQVVGLDASVLELEQAIARAERALDEHVADLYGLDAESRERMRSG